MTPVNDDDRMDLLRELMEAHSRDVFQVLYSYVKDRYVAEDLAQEVFVKVYDHIHSFRQESSYKTWIMRIAVNRAKDFLRSAARRMTYVEDLSHIHSEESVEKMVINKVRDEELWQAVLNLPDLYREVIWLFYAKDTTVEEISQILDISVSSVKTRLFRGRDMLKKVWEGSVEYDTGR